MNYDSAFLKLAAEARTLLREQPGKAIPLGVREESEWAQGHIAGAVHASHGILEQKISAIAPDSAQPIVCYCAGGNRSALAAKSLQDLGYTHVLSVEGGLNAWNQPPA
jgi:rhodanese-related sulfurtransferase